MSRVLATLDTLIAGGTVPRAHADELRAVVVRASTTRASRAEAAIKSSRERSRAMRQRIREAVRASPLSEQLHVLVAVVERRMGRGAPSRPTIRDELRRMKEEKPVPKRACR